MDISPSGINANAPAKHTGIPMTTQIATAGLRNKVSNTRTSRAPCQALLSSEQATFVVPVPSWEVRAVIEKAREDSIANPKHENEKLDAEPAVLRALWQDVNALARQMHSVTMVAILAIIFNAKHSNYHTEALLYYFMIKQTHYGASIRNTQS